MLSEKIRKNDVICFFGDSITADGRWIAEIFDHLISTENEKRIKLINCGVPGDTAEHAVSRLYSDCLVHLPDYVVIMFGMNDIQRDLYSNGCTDANKDEQKNKALKIHKNSMRQIIDECIKMGSEVILCTPTPCDEVHAFGVDIGNCNTGLLKCREFVIESAKECELDFVDFTPVIINELNHTELIADDCVHPNDTGHHVIAQEFLKQTGFIDNGDHSAYIMSDGIKNWFDIESRLRLIKFTEWCLLYDFYKDNRTTIDEKKQIARERLKSETNNFAINMYKLYIDHVDYKEDYVGRLMETLGKLYK